MKVSYVKTLPPVLRKQRSGKWKAIFMQILKENKPALVEFENPQQKKNAERSLRAVISHVHRDTFKVTSHSPLSFSIAKKEPQS